MDPISKVNQQIRTGPVKPRQQNEAAKKTEERTASVDSFGGRLPEKTPLWSSARPRVNNSKIDPRMAMLSQATMAGIKTDWVQEKYADDELATEIDPSVVEDILAGHEATLAGELTQIQEQAKVMGAAGEKYFREASARAVERHKNEINRKLEEKAQSTVFKEAGKKESQASLRDLSRASARSKTEEEKAEEQERRDKLREQTAFSAHL